MISYWEQKRFFRHRHLIICGAGFTGLSAAISFKEKFPDGQVLVLEKDPFTGGASTKNAGFACFGSPSELIADIRRYGEDQTFQLVEKRWRGLQGLRKMLGDSAIGYEHKHGFEIFSERDPLFGQCMDQLSYLNAQVAKITGEAVYFPADRRIVDFGFSGIAHIIENTGEGQVDTGDMYSSLLSLAREKGVEVFNGIEVEGFEGEEKLKIGTNYGSVTCDRFVIATNGFASQMLPSGSTGPARAQVLVTTPVKGLAIAGSFHMDEGYYYFRDVDGRVLMGGGRNLDFEGETTSAPGLNHQIQMQLEHLLRSMILPRHDFAIAQRWSGIMGVGREKRPVVQQISPNVYCAIRLSGMGLALSTLLGREVVELME